MPTSVTGSPLYCKSLHTPVLHFWGLDSRVHSHDKEPSWEAEEAQAQQGLRFQFLQLPRGFHDFWLSQVYLLLAGHQSLRPCLWPGLFPSNQEPKLMILVALVNLFLFHSCAKSRQLHQLNLCPCHQYPIDNVHIKFTNQTFTCCIRKFKVKLGDRQWLLLKYANAT